MKRLIRHVWGGLLVCVFSCGIVLAQGGTAQISGMVTDHSGAVLPGVEVTATQTQTGISRMTVTNETGSYVLPNLPVGPYKLEVALQGFRTFVQTGIVLQVNGSVVISAVLEVGQLTETIEVQANASMVETRATGVGQVIENAQILQLPLIGRKVQDLVVLAGGSVLTTTANASGRTFPGVAHFSIAGGLDRGTSFTLDGANHNDVRQNAGLPLPFPDALQEFKVETNAVPAQYGFRSGGAVNAVTKSGTNEFHGSLFEFVRNGKFNARNFFAAKRDTLKRNQFGGTIGGPILENKLFFFGGYQGTTTRQAPSDSTSFVPTAAMIAGDFSKYLSTACRATPLTLPSPFVNNVLPESLLSPAAVALAKKLPPAIDECGTTKWGTPSRQGEHQIVGKVDYQFKPKHSMFWRYMANPYEDTLPYSLANNLLVTNPPGQSNLFQSFTFGDTITIGNNVVNSLRLAWDRERVQRVAAYFFGASDIGVKNFYQPLPRLDLNVSNAFSIGTRTGVANKYNENGYQIADDLGVVRGNHELRFGGNWMGFQTNNAGASFSLGAFTFSGDSTGVPLADLMLGRVTSLAQGGPNFMYARTKVFGAYGQDTWKVKPNLTLSYGLRWEPYLPTKLFDTMEYFNLEAFLRGDRTTKFVNAPAGLFYPGDSQFPATGSPSTAININWKQFAPRVGVVWDPLRDGKTVVRAAWGIFYDTQSAEIFISMGQGPPWGSRLTLNGVSLDDPWRDFAGGNPFPFVLNANTPYQQGGAFSVITNRNTRPPYVGQWNFGIQREVARDWLVSASYIGNEVTHLYGAIELNPGIYIPGVANANGLCTATVMGRPVSVRVAAGATCSTTTNVQARRTFALLDTDATRKGDRFGFVNAWDDGGTRNYQGMLLSVTKRMGGHFSLTGNYTWSHCIGDPTNVLLNPGAAGLLTDPANRNYDRGDCTTSGTDLRHITNANGEFDMPMFSNRWLQRVAGNWRITGILRARSGNPLAPTVATDRALTGINTGAQRPDVVSSETNGNQCKSDLLAANPTCRWLNANAFAQPAMGTVGSLGGGTVRGPRAITIDAGLARTFNVTEKQRLEFRAEASNVFNHTNLNDPIVSLGATFGRITSAADPRIMQFGIRYVF